MNSVLSRAAGCSWSPAIIAACCDRCGSPDWTPCWSWSPQFQTRQTRRGNTADCSCSMTRWPEPWVDVLARVIDGAHLVTGDRLSTMLDGIVRDVGLTVDLLLVDLA